MNGWTIKWCIGKFDVEKGAWFKVGVAVQNPSDVPIVVSVVVENADVRIE